MVRGVCVCQAAGDGVILARGRRCLMRFGVTPHCCRCLVCQVVPAMWQEEMPLASGVMVTASCTSGSEWRKDHPPRGNLIPVLFPSMIYETEQVLTNADDPIPGVPHIADTDSVSWCCSPALCLGGTAPVAPLTSINSWTGTTAEIKLMCWTGSCFSW